MAEELDNQQQEQNPEEIAQEETYAKLASGEMSLDKMVNGEEPTTQKEEPTAQEPSEKPEEKQAVQEKDAQEETLESYKLKSQQEIDRLNKIAKDNQAEFTRRSQELSATKAELAELKEQLEQLQKAKAEVEDIDMKALEDYPDDVKKLFKALSEKNKALENQVASVGKFVREEEKRRASEDARMEELRKLQQDFAQNILPKIIAEEPEYDSFMRKNMQGYQEWASSLSEGERFSFLNSKDPRDLIRGYREYKKFLNLPYEKEAIKQAVKENENKTGLYSTNAAPTRRVAPAPGTPQLTEEEAYQLEIERQAKEYNQRR